MFRLGGKSVITGNSDFGGNSDRELTLLDGICGRKVKQKYNNY